MSTNRFQPARLWRALLPALLMATVPARAVTYDPLTATPWVQARVEGSIPTDEESGSLSSASAGSSSADGGAGAALNAALGSMVVTSQANFDWLAAGARTVVDWDYFTIQGITGPVTITAHFQISGAVHAGARTKSARLDTALDYESEYASGNQRSQWSVCDGCTQQSGLLSVDADLARSFQVSREHPYFRLRYWLIGDVYHAGTFVNATGQLSFDLPEGATVTSKAGFLAPVPEPETGALMGVALGLIGWRVRGMRRYRGW